MYEPNSLRGMLHTMLNTAEQHLVEGQPGVGAAEARALLKDARAWVCLKPQGSFDRTQLERLAILEIRCAS
jgi:hypothetical protein